MKLFYVASQKLILGILLSLITSTAFAAGQQCKTYYIQLFVTASSDKAMVMQSTYSNVGFDAAVTSFNSNGRTLYRLRIGPYSVLSKATESHQKMKALLSGNAIAQASIIRHILSACEKATPLPALKNSTSLDESARKRFANFKAPAMYTGKNHPLVMDEFSRLFKTRLDNAINTQKPSFAGQYLVTGWGCGSSGCNTGAVIDAKTGIVTPFPTSLSSVYPLKPMFADEDGQEQRYTLNSRLMIFAGNLESDNSPGLDMIESYEFKNGKFVFLDAQAYGRAKPY